MDEAMRQQENMEDDGEVWEDATVELDTGSFNYLVKISVKISLVSIVETGSHRLVLEEQMTFESIPSFLRVDL